MSNPAHLCIAKRIVDAVTVSGNIIHSLLSVATLSNLPECPFARGKPASSIKLRTERLRDTDSGPGRHRHLHNAAPDASWRCFHTRVRLTRGRGEEDGSPR